MNSNNEILEFSELNKIEVDVVHYLCKNSNLKCKCGLYRKIKPSKQSKVKLQLAITCGNPQCNPMFGIKRPEHSATMKLLANDQNSAFSKTLMKKGEVFNSKVNSIDFKKTILMKNSIIVSDEEVENVYSKFLSDSRKSSSYRGNQILIRYNKWEQYYKELIEKSFSIKPTKEWLDTLSDDEIQKAWKFTHSINSLRNMKNSENVGKNSFFKQQTLSGLRYNTQNKFNVTFRSGWEYEMAVIFEEGCIPWSFEELTILSIDKQSFYIPDFIIMLNGKKSIIEIKGGFFNQDKDLYLKNKIQAGVNFAKENDYNFYMLYKKPKINFREQLIDMR